MVVRQEHFCCNCVCKSGGISEFIVKIVKKKKLKKGLHSNDLPDLSNGTEIKTEPTIFKKPGMDNFSLFYFLFSFLISYSSYFQNFG